tara:strand:- start:8805 stop:9230 length:426 start_codon:yes stop_codon:yes gene_type:complete
MRDRKTVTINDDTITERMLWDWLVTAFEGGSNYWIGRVKVSKKTMSLHSLFATEFDKTISGWRWFHQVPFVLETDNFKGHELEIDTPSGVKFLAVQNLFDAIEIMAINCHGDYQLLVTENYDAFTADIFLQYALFQDVIYG